MFGMSEIRTRDLLSVKSFLVISRATFMLERSFFQHLVALLEFYQCAKFHGASSIDDGFRAFSVKNVFCLWHVQLAPLRDRTPLG